MTLQNVAIQGRENKKKGYILADVLQAYEIRIINILVIM